MAFSLFSGSQSSEHTFPGKSSEAVLAVRTMQDDLKNIESGGQDSPQSPVEIGQYKSAGTSFGTGAASLAVNPFSEEGEQLFQSQAKTAESQSGNPFGVVLDHSNSRPSSNFSQQPTLENGLTPLMARGELLSNMPTMSRKPLLIGTVGAAVLLLAGVGTWYFFFGNEEQSLESVSPSNVIQKTSEIPENLPPKQSPFALGKPNYLSFNIETVSSQDIRRTLSQAADRIIAADIREPIEFLITDQNNNPLAFSRFVFLLKLELDSDVLALIDEKFSLYAYNDAGRPRFGLVLTFKNAQDAASLIERTEVSLPYALQALILEPNISVGKRLTFRSTGYDQFLVRFANIDSDQNISLDYSLYGSQLFIGTSKNTLRAILDASAK